MKQFGLLGEKLGHSFSGLIHSMLGEYSYSMFEKKPEELELFFSERLFDGLNVTIPYKETVVKYCSRLSAVAEKIGCVNTLVVEADGQISGYNTDYYGFDMMVKKSGADICGKKAIILGNGGACKTVRAVLDDRNAAEIVVISRNGENNYENIQKNYDAQIIVNCTPVGMYPNNGVSLIDLAKFKQCECVLDLIYNPAKTKLLMDADRLGIPNMNGLLMLCAQAKKASELFMKTSLNENICEEIEKQISMTTKNIVLIGMPGSGKSTVGKLLAGELNRNFYDTDSMVEDTEKMSIPQIFSQYGEAKFRNMESRAAEYAGKQSGAVIATGGGIVKTRENFDFLRQNSVVIFLNRDISELATEGRPLSKDIEALKQLFAERIDLYRELCDFEFKVKNNSDADNCAYDILKKLNIRRK